MKKGMILPITGAITAGALGVVNIIPPVISIFVILALIGCRDVILMFLMRGLPYAIILQRLSGGVLFGVWDKQNTIKVDRFVPVAGTIQTKRHGFFNLMSDRIYNIDGVPFAVAPANIGYNVGIDQALLVKEIKKRGFSQISDYADLNEHGQVVGLKDKPELRDLKKKFEFKPPAGEPLDLSGMNDLYRYTKEASNPYHMDARVKMGISQGLGGEQTKGPNYGLYIVAIIAIIAGLVALSLILGQHQPAETAIRVITENSATTPTVIPA